MTAARRIQAASEAERAAFARVEAAERGWQEARAAYDWGRGPEGSEQRLHAAKEESRAAIAALQGATAELDAVRRAAEEEARRRGA